MNCFRKPRRIRLTASGRIRSAGVRDLVQTRAWQLGLGGDVTFYSKPAVLDAAYGVHPVSFEIFLRVRTGLETKSMQ